MAATRAAAGTFLSASSFGRRNIASSSFSSLYLRLTIPPPRFAPLVARSTRFSAVPVPLKRGGCVPAAASAAGSPQFGSGENDSPYEILGISPLDGFDQVKMAYKWRPKNAENSGDAAYLFEDSFGPLSFCIWCLYWCQCVNELELFWFQLERAYDTAVMMKQLQNRKKGVAYGSIQVSKDIKYADNQPIVPWGPRG